MIASQNTSERQNPAYRPTSILNNILKNIHLFFKRTFFNDLFEGYFSEFELKWDKVEKSGIKRVELSIYLYQGDKR